MAICNRANFPKWEYNASLWVAHKTALNAVMNSKTYVEDAGQKIYKKLGDFSVSKDTTHKETPTRDLIHKLECELLKLSVAVKFCKEPLIDCVKGVASNDLRNSSAAQLVKKGELVSAPMFGRTFRQQGRHPQLTRYIKEYDRIVLTNSPNVYPAHSNGEDYYDLQR
jgi:hypothetical protein